MANASKHKHNGIQIAIVQDRLIEFDVADVPRTFSGLLAGLAFEIEAGDTHSEVKQT